MSPAIQLKPSDIDGDWRALGVCGEVGGDLWFSEAAEDIVEAKRLCNQTCPVRDICRAEFIPASEQYGIFGGLDPEERRQQPGYHLRPLVDEFLPYLAPSDDAPAAAAAAVEDELDVVADLDDDLLDINDPEAFAAELERRAA